MLIDKGASFNIFAKTNKFILHSIIILCLWFIVKPVNWDYFGWVIPAGAAYLFLTNAFELLRNYRLSNIHKYVNSAITRIIITIFITTFSIYIGFHFFKTDKASPIFFLPIFLIKDILSILTYLFTVTAIHLIIFIMFLFFIIFPTFKRFINSSISILIIFLLLLNIYGKNYTSAFSNYIHPTWIVSIFFVYLIILHIFYRYSILERSIKILNNLFKDKLVKNICYLFFFILLGFIFYFIRTRVFFAEDWDYHLHTISGFILYKEPFCRITTHFLYWLLRNIWNTPVDPWRIASIVLGIFDIFLLYKIYSLIIKKDKKIILLGSLLTVLPYVPLQLFLGYPNKKIYELFMVILFVFLGCTVILKNKKFFLFGIILGTGYCCHNGTFLSLSLPFLVAILLSSTGMGIKIKIRRLAIGILGAIIPYFLIYSYSEGLGWFLKLFNKNDPAMAWELSYILPFNKIFTSYHMSRIWDTFNAFCPIGSVLLIAKKYTSGKIINSPDKIGYFFILSIFSYGFLVMRRDLTGPWFNFDNPISLAILLNIAGYYFWSSAELESRYKLLIPILAYILLQSTIFVFWTNTHWNQLFWSKKEEAQFNLTNYKNLKLVDSIDVGNATSEFRHNYKIGSYKDDWRFFYPPADGSRVYKFAKIKSPAREMVFMYPNKAFVVDNGRLVKGYEEFTVKASAGKNLLLLNRFTTKVIQSRAEVYVNNKYVGVYIPFFYTEAKKYIAEPLIKNQVNIAYQQNPETYSEWQFWTENALLIPGDFIKRDDITITIKPYNNEVLQSFYYFIYVPQNIEPRMKDK